MTLFSRSKNSSLLATTDSCVRLFLAALFLFPLFPGCGPADAPPSPESSGTVDTDRLNLPSEISSETEEKILETAQSETLPLPNESSALSVPPTPGGMFDASLEELPSAEISLAPNPTESPVAPSTPLVDSLKTAPLDETTLEEADADSSPLLINPLRTAPKRPAWEKPDAFGIRPALRFPSASLDADCSFDDQRATQVGKSGR